MFIFFFIQWDPACSAWHVVEEKSDKESQKGQKVKKMVLTFQYIKELSSNLMFIEYFLWKFSSII